MTDDAVERLIESIDRLRDEVECLSKVVSKGFHIIRNEMREARTEDHGDFGGE